jgi:3-dehydroquinate synthase
MPNKILTIDLETKSYDIYIGAGLLTHVNDYIPEDVSGRSLFIVTDKNVEPYVARITEGLHEAGAKSIDVFVLPPGEKTKSFTQYEELCNWMLSHGVNRDSFAIAVGGGVVGDITGYAAATVLRGIDFIQIPTTLLAQVDSSVGGKTGINTAHGKNLLGAFHQPIGVITDLSTLNTLSDREFKAGYAELAKHGLINDSSLFSWLEKNMQGVLSKDPEDLSEAVERACAIKADIVAADERETGRRGLLNLGHTFGHALEAAAGYDGTLLHGEGVAIGAVMAFDLSARMGLCESDDVERVETHFAKAGLPTRASMITPALKTSIDDLMTTMKRDKKVKGGKMTFIVTSGIGEAFISQDVPEDLVRDVLKDSLGGDVRKGVTTKGTKLTANHSFMGGMKQRWKSNFSSQ